MESKAGAAPTAPAMTSLHDIILDYVINSAYTDTARVLAQSSSGDRTRTQASPTASPTPPLTGADDAAAASASAMDVDAGAPLGGGDRAERDSVILDDAVLASIDRRREILDYILSGAIVRAVAALNTHFPAVLNPTTAAALSALRNGAEPSHSNGTSTNGAESNGVGNGATNGASNLSPYLSQPSSSSSRARTAPSTAGAAAPPPAPIDRAVPLFPRSSDPGHVKLNLGIQRFIEEMRGVPTQSAASSPSSSIDSLTGSTALSGDPLHDLMATHQELQMEATKLRPEHRAAYLQEIKDVTALLTYINPEASILSGLLEQKRRIALAQQVNAAILRSEGRPVQSHLEQIARTTSAIYSTLHDAGIDPQPSWTADSKSVDNWRIADQLKRRSFQKGGFSLHEYVRELA